MGTFTPISDAAADPNQPFSDGDIAKEKSEAALAGGELIAGKFKSYADLEKGYQELYQRYRSRANADPDDDDEEPPAAPPEEDEEEADEEETGGLDEADVNAIAEEFGGFERVAAMANWASEKLSEKEIDKYNKLVASDDPDIVRGAIAALERKYEKANGKGKQAKGRGDLDGAGSRSFRQEVKGYRSFAEFERDLDDPRYENDPAFNAQVIEKVAMSPHIFNTGKFR